MDAARKIPTAQDQLAGGRPFDLLERTWKFFASVRVATVLIFVIAAASIAGSLIIQEGFYDSWKPPQVYYPEHYGPILGSILYETGLTSMYTSWWYLTLLFMMGASLVICSLERFIPLWQTVQHPDPTPPAGFVKGMKNQFRFQPFKCGDPLSPLIGALKQKRYTVVQAGDRLYADKGRWGRWGPYITHVGLIFILLGAMARAVPGLYFDQMIWVRDGETVQVPNTDWFVRSNKFTAEFLETGQAKSYQTDATVIEQGREVKQQIISMNQPLWHRWVELYQTSYKHGLGNAKVALSDRSSGQYLGEFQLDLVQPAETYAVAGHTIILKEYYPNFGLDAQGKPTSLSAEVKNPGLVLQITGPDGRSFPVIFFVTNPEMEFTTNTPFKLQTLGMEIAATTGLKVRKDLGIPVIYLGLLITSLGVCLTFYLPHRRYWALVDGAHVLVGGWTNRNSNSFQEEMQALATRLDPITNPQIDLTRGEER